MPRYRLHCYRSGQNRRLKPELECPRRHRLSVEDDSYTLNDIIGKGGIEQYMDADLKGSKGYEKLYVDHLGKGLEIIEREEPTINLR